MTAGAPEVVGDLVSTFLYTVNFAVVGCLHNIRRDCLALPLRHNADCCSAVCKAFHQLVPKWRLWI